MKKHNMVGLITGIAAGAAAAVAGGLAVARVIKEMKSDPQENQIFSPDGTNSVTLSYGVSEFGKGLTLIKVLAQTENGEDECKFAFVAGNGAKNVQYQWVDNENFELTVGKGLLQQCCDVEFTEDQINIAYYWHKIVNVSVNHPVEAEEEAVEEAVEEVVEEAVEEPATETVEEAVEEPAAETVEEAVEEPAAEIVEKVAEDVAQPAETSEQIEQEK